MKKRNFFKMSNIIWIMMLAVATTFVACDDDPDPDPDPEIVLDGTYIKGDATALTTFDAKGQMTTARNEVNQEDRVELMELYIAIKATGGFNIVTVAGDVQTVFGPSADFAEVTELDGDEPTLGLQRGTVDVTDTQFTVPEDGLYHVAYDTEIGVVTIAKVEWGVIGAATPGGWSGSTQLATTFDLNTMVFEATDVMLTKADFKFRYSNGWKVILDPLYDLGGGVVGIKVNTNFGGTLDALVAGGDNISNETPGYYTITVTWSLANGTTAAVVKTGDVSAIDYSETSLGLIGDGLMVDGAQHNWDVTLFNHVPEISNETTYTWTYSGVEVTTLGSFKIRQGQTWDEKSIGYNDVVMAGAAAADFEGTEGDGNFKPLVDGVYDFVLVIDAMTETYTLTVTAAGAPAMLWVPGTYCAWVHADATTLTDPEDDGIFTGTVEFADGAENYTFKFTSQGDWEGTNYGAGANDGELSTDGSAGDLEVPGAGTYMFTVDINALTWTYELQ